MPLIKVLARFQKESTDKLSKKINIELETQEIILGDKFNKDLERVNLEKNIMLMIMCRFVLIPKM